MMDKFFRVEAKSDEECTLMLMQPAEGGSYPVWQMDLPVNTLRALNESIDSFLVLRKFGII